MKTKTPHKLPTGQLTILALCRLSEPIAMTSVFPYLPEMIESFGVPKNDIAKWAGWSSTIFCLCQAFTAIFWGRLSDHYGRKPIILFGLANTAATVLLWGFSTNLTMAMIARALQGFMSGNVGIIRTMVAELCPWKELQPRAFSIMPLVWNVGSVIGPAFGGVLVKQSHHGDLLERYPYALPNIFAAALFAVSITIGFLFLHETLETAKDKRDIGRTLGDALLKAVNPRSFNSCYLQPPEVSRGTEEEPLLQSAKSPTDDEETVLCDNSIPNMQKEANPKWKEVFRLQSTFALMAYTLLAMHDFAYQQLLPVFMYHPFDPRDSSDASQPLFQHLPFLFNRGFGLSHTRIGVFFSIAGAFSMLVQFFIFPPITSHFGTLRTFKTCITIYPFIYLLTPYTVLLPTEHTRQAALLLAVLLKQSVSVFMFPCCIILLTNSACSLKVLGTLNGVAMTTSGLGRAAGPALAGNLFTVGVEMECVLLPYAVLAAVAVLSLVPAYFMAECKGFGSSDEEEEEADEEEREDERAC
ncbi:MFS general substrate transporter [Pseudovirgaria hyperparasitica]|uniref:MFS general substrate transporter n=1 Tax=Pseudovirgaria hyperparasitica TaxID=470096 RepID=A0A6A6W0N9_9PEZI|nr:MFS general substrate transporter [Pseudovirgaria hyperparasitica]KAF2755137.1 MFS general substrate transporter [Pseudovirgaria hyperparasitica]